MIVARAIRSGGADFVRVTARTTDLARHSSVLCRTTWPGAAIATRLQLKSSSSSSSSLSSEAFQASASMAMAVGKGGKSSIIGVNEFQRYVCSIVPSLDFTNHKGQSGRIGIVGGSEVFVGAPYYASMAALRLGADLAYVFTTKEAAAPMKTFSPELMVHPYLDDSNCAQLLETVLPKLHALVIGCGLSLNPQVQDAVAHLIGRARELNLPIIIDASAFPMILTKLDLIRGYRRAILTPNIREFQLLYKHAVQDENPPPVPGPDTVEALATRLGNVTVLVKGSQDYISDGCSLVISDEMGCPRRCGGQGDILAGLLSTFAFWAFQAQANGTLSKSCPLSPAIVAGLGASMVTRRCARNTFKRMRRSMLVTDMFGEIRESFTALFPVD